MAQSFCTGGSVEHAAEEDHLAAPGEDDEMAAEFCRMFACENSTSAWVEVPVCDTQHVSVPTDPAPFVPRSMQTWPNRGGMEQTLQECTTRAHKRQLPQTAASASRNDDACTLPQPDLLKVQQSTSISRNLLRSRSAVHTPRETTPYPLGQYRKAKQGSKGKLQVSPLTTTSQGSWYPWHPLNTDDVMRALDGPAPVVAAPCAAPGLHTSTSVGANPVQEQDLSMVHPAARFGPSSGDKNHYGQSIVDVVDPVQERLAPWLIDQGPSTMLDQVMRASMVEPVQEQVSMAPRQHRGLLESEVKTLRFIDKVLNHSSSSESSDWSSEDQPNSPIFSEQLAPKQPPALQSSPAREHAAATAEQKQGKAPRTTRKPKYSPRFHWYPEIHNQFLTAIAELGGPNLATPKRILAVMGFPKGIDQYNIKSHLQKLRNELQVASNIMPANAGAEMAMQELLHNTLTKNSRDLQRILDEQNAYLLQMLEYQKIQSKVAEANAKAWTSVTGLPAPVPHRDSLIIELHDSD